MTPDNISVPDGNYIGIDPGLTGGVAMIRYSDGELSLLEARRMPVKEQNGANVIDVAVLEDYFSGWDVTAIVIEEQEVRSGNSAQASRTTMRNYGMLLGWSNLRCGNVRIVQAAKWKKDSGIPADKTEAMKIASDLFGNGYWPRQRDDGVAEAALIARWGVYSIHPAAEGATP